MLTALSLLSVSPLAGIILLFQLLVTTTFIPYKVDRPSRRVPYVTYSLMGLNTFIFFLTVLIANGRLPEDRIRGNILIDQINGPPTAVPVLQVGGISQQEQAKIQRRARVNRALAEAGKKINDAASYRRYYQISHADSLYVLEPHYSVLNLFAYRPGDRSPWSKLLGILGSMFLHSGFMHLAGNMLFLWAFGRAMEDNLGSKVFLGAYLLSGVAAVLLFHITTMLLAPGSQMLPYLGASGAVAGVMGFFTLRFYRTLVNIFYIQGCMLAIVMGLAFGGAIIAYLLSSSEAGALLGFFSVWAIVLLTVRKLIFGTFRIPSAWAIGVWLVVFNILPAIGEAIARQSGGVAVWAHIGGFLFGMGYAGLLGSKSEGGREYLLEDAQKALEVDSNRAGEYARNLLEREPENGGAYHVLAASLARQHNENDALDNYELAVRHLLRVGERDQAADAYLEAVRQYPTFILQPDQQLAVGNQMAKTGNFQSATETLVKIPYTFPDAPESEISLLRSAQLYLQHLNDPAMSQQLINDFLRRYPDSPWMPQVNKLVQMVQAAQSGSEMAF